MQLDNFISLTIENAHPPHKQDKWFRLYKFCEEYTEFLTETEYSNIKAELEDTLFCFALLTPHTQKISNTSVVYTENMMEISMIIKCANKHDDEMYDWLYSYFYNKFSDVGGIEERCQSAYERLVCDSLLSV
jgi:hypothetical protein